jgi:23S rRNA (guanosine2251-2'-O)-methyltransferase
LLNYQGMIVIAHNIRSLHNVGSIFRSANAFGVEKLYLTGYTGAPPRKEIAKVSLKAEHTLPWESVEHVEGVVESLKNDGYTILALDNISGAESIDAVKPGDKLALILGNEVEGIDEPTRALCDKIILIPTKGHKKSLNVSVATGVALFALTSDSR